MYIRVPEKFGFLSFYTQNHNAYSANANMHEFFQEREYAWMHTHCRRHPHVPRNLQLVSRDAYAAGQHSMYMGICYHRHLHACGSRIEVSTATWRRKAEALWADGRWQQPDAHSTLRGGVAGNLSGARITHNNNSCIATVQCHWWCHRDTGEHMQSLKYAANKQTCADCSTRNSHCARHTLHMPYL